MVGSSDKVRNLYYLVMSNKMVCSSSSIHVTLPDNSIWHFRNGHISVNHMHTLHSQLYFINVDSKFVYGVCHFSK